MDAPPPSAPAILVLHARDTASPPPPPELDLLALAERTQYNAPTSPLLIQLVATLTSCAALALCTLVVRCYRRLALRRYLAGLPEASTDGAWLVVSFEWGAQGVQSATVPLDGIVRAQPAPQPALFFSHAPRVLTRHT